MTEKIQTNKAQRVLSGTELKYTCVIFMKSARVFEVQSEQRPSPAFSDSTRSVLLCGGKYGGEPICEWGEAEAVFAELNPGKSE